MHSRRAALFSMVLMASSVFAMRPATRSVQVSPGFALRGLGAVTPARLGLTLTHFQSKRDTRRSGTRDVANPDNEKSENAQTIFLADYRATDRWSVVLSVPYISNEASFTDNTTGRRVHQEGKGLGDLGVYGRYSFWKDRPLNPTHEWWGILGVELPTGSTEENDEEGIRLSATQQPGSGATDFIIGASYAWTPRRLSYYGEATYKKHGDRAYVFGDVFRVNAGVNAPLGFSRFGLIAEINGEFSGRDESKFTGAPGRSDDGTVFNTGGEIVSFSPALQWRPGGRWALSAGVQIPVFQKFRGTQLKSDVNYNLSGTTSFGGQR